MTLKNLAEHLTKRSTEICLDNDCAEENHFCESYAYLIVGEDGAQLLDICSSDYFIGDPECNCALPLPFKGDEKELLDQINLYRDDEEN